MQSSDLELGRAYAIQIPESNYYSGVLEHQVKAYLIDTRRYRKAEGPDGPLGPDGYIGPLTGREAKLLGFAVQRGKSSWVPLGLTASFVLKPWEEYDREQAQAIWAAHKKEQKREKEREEAAVKYAQVVALLSELDAEPVRVYTSLSMEMARISREPVCRMSFDDLLRILPLAIRAKEYDGT